MQATTNTAARPSVPGSTSTAGSMTVPIDTRNIGISSADPKNSMRSMNSPSLGTIRFSASPQKNAPTMPSMPTTSATTAADSRAASMKA